VASVGLGVVLAALAVGVAREAVLHGGGGWFNYAPNSAVSFGAGSVLGRATWWEVATTVIAAVIWAGVSIWIFRPERQSEPVGASEGRD
jgi:hypothetical protein